MRIKKKVHKQVDKTVTWGSLEDLGKKQTYTLRVDVQLGTGERPTLWTGALDLG